MYMIWSTKDKPFRDCSLWYRGCYAIGWAIEGCPGKGILDNPHMYIFHTQAHVYIWATVKTPAILNMYSTDIGLWKLMEIVKNTR